MCAVCVDYSGKFLLAMIYSLFRERSTV